MRRANRAFRLTRALAGALALAAALLCTGACPALAAPLPESSPLYSPSGGIVDENPDVSAEYAGKVTELWEYPAIEGGLEHVHRTATMEFSEGVSGPADQIEYTGIYGPESIHWKLASLSGSVEEDSTEAGGNPITCSGSFQPMSTEGGTQGVFLPLETPGHPAGGGNPETNPDYNVRPPFGIPSELLHSTGPASSHCQTSEWNNNGNLGWGGPTAFGDATVQAEWGDVAFPSVYFPPGGSHTQPLNFSYTCQPPQCGPETNGKGQHFGKVSLTLESHITFSSPGLGGEGTPITVKSPPAKGGETFGPPTPFDWLSPDKRAARLDLDPALENAKFYCTPYALGLGGFGTGVLLLGSGVGGSLAIAGSITASAAAPFCFATLKRVGADLKRYKDPPDGRIHEVAVPAAAKAPALASCPRRLRGKRKSFCEKLRTSESKWVQGADQAAAIDEALVTTTNRASAALAAGDRSAIALQGEAGKRLEGQEAGALAAKNAAGREVATILRGAGIRFRLSAKQSRATIAAVQRALAKQGVSASELASLGSPSLKPGAADLLAGLGR